jgi:hypothetical protein
MAKVVLDGSVLLVVTGITTMLLSLLVSQSHSMP